ncbi:hypothetical protein RD792_006076 [Penstemon davidsonii]|uniref:SBP-type domain-containing protein n=1 Tax=Penstemon davidsonii TaxID=160366 RepID=A0ABR0DEX7_9LAMI|nr:hypothetical protein RD792_006076 [Penstemon davidsonii]
MEGTRIGGGAQMYYGVGKTNLEWDPNDWKWNGDLFIATPLNHSTTAVSKQLFPLSCNTSSSCSDELNQHNTVREFDKKRRVNVVEDSNNLTLKLGGEDCTAGKKTKLTAVCQVEDCRADLSKAKDYHRRHKVCEVHSKATKALVANQMQRFCQQCSRFHSLQEFDEGKRSCRRRLAGHNKRRRKAQPDGVINNNNNPLNDEQASGYLLMSILKLLSSMHSNRTNQTDDQDLLSHLLQSLANQGSFNLESQNLLNSLPSFGNSELVNALLSHGSTGQRPGQQHCTSPGDDIPGKDCEIQGIPSQRPGTVLPIEASSQIYAQGRETSGGRGKMNDFDLNDVFVDSDDGMEDLERSTVPLGLGTWVQQESDQSSPPQTSGNSDSASAQSPSSSSGDAQSRTDRIVFKLFGKDPSDFPIVLRAQIFNWLSHSPTDIESYIRPGCVILTIYLRLPESAWDELCCGLSSSLSRLLHFSDDINFWSTGWIYIRVQNQMAFIYNGQIVIDTSLPFETDNNCTILSVKPIAVTSSGRAQFVIKGFNLSLPSTRLVCALEGKSLETNCEAVENVDGLERHDVQCLTFSCSIPSVTGRGFIEVEDHGLSSNFFPFIVAEDDVCTEIRMLEKEIEFTEVDNLNQGTGKPDARNQAMEFIHEMGWLLHKFHSKSRFENEDDNLGFYSFERFKYLVEFSIDHEWCAVVNKLLNILFHGIVSNGEQPFLKFALSEMGLLHRAVRRNSKPLVEMLLRYVPEKVADELSFEYKTLVETEQSFLFRPDVVGPGGLTPLHLAAGRDGSEDILYVLTDDPRKVGIAAWKSALDSTGFSPEDYARLRGHYSYIHLIQRKINKNMSSGHVVVDISDTLSKSSINQKCATASFEIGKFDIQRDNRPCGICDQKLAYRTGSRTLLYKPAMLSMLAVAAVCVCVALLFKSSPRVLFVFRPFSWEMLEYGSS